MKVLKLLFFFVATSVLAQTPANNDCANAESITVSESSALSLPLDFTQATESLDASCNTATTDNKDLWYQFTMPIDGILRVSNASNLLFSSLYENCGGAEISCGQSTSSFGNLVSGTTYLLRLSFQFASATSVNLQAISPIANDECANAEVLGISTANFLQPNPDSSLASASVVGSCDSGNSTYLDLWYEFEMPVNGTVEVSLSNNDQNFTLYDACSGAELQCFNNSGLFLNLSQNTTYILRVAERSPDAGPMIFRLQAYEYAANDECANAETIIIETDTPNTYPTDLRAATESLDSSCETASNTNYDLWYNFIMPVTGNLKIDQFSGVDTVTIYESCGGVEISCQSGVQYIPLTAGTNYTLRISSITPSNRNPRFQAFEAVPNAECSQSDVITVSTAEVLSYPVDVRGSTESISGSCDLSTNDYLDIWYEFSMPVNGNVQISSLGSDEYLVLFSECGEVELDCFRGSGTFFNLLANTTYKLRVGQPIIGSSNSNSPRTMGIQAFEVLANDECADALPITVESGQSNTYSVNVAAATESLDASCNAATIENLDVWYSFTMPVGGNLQISDVASNQSFSVFDACGGNELQCFTNDGTFNNLVSGTEYILRVSEPESQSGTLSFTVQAFEVIPNDECNDALSLSIQSGQALTITTNLAAATESLDATCESVSNNNLDVWYSFTMPVSGNVFISTAADENYSLYSSCGGSELECFSGDGLFLGLIANSSYLLRVAESDTEATDTSFDIQAISQASNDECDLAQNLLVEANQSNDYSVQTIAATESIDASCENLTDENLDIWFEVTMPINGSLNITGAQNATTFALFDGCFGGNTDRSTNMELGCFKGNGVFENLVGGITYILRVSQNALFLSDANFSAEATATLSNVQNNLVEVSVFPNPTKGLIYIRNTKNNAVNSATICDLNGRIVMQLQPEQFENGIDISKLRTAMYLLIIQTDLGSSMIRLLKD